MKVLLLNIVEKIVAKGESAHYGQFPLLSQCFQKLSTADAQVIFYIYMYEQFPILSLPNVQQIVSRRL